MKDLEKIKSEEVAAQVQDANPGNFAIEQEVAQLVGATVPAPTEPSEDDARELGAQLLVFLRRALTPIKSALRTAVAAIYAHLDSRCTDYTPAAYAPFRILPYDPMGSTPRTLPNLLTALTAFSARKISNGSATADGIPDGISLAHLLCSTSAASSVTEIKDDNTGWVMNKALPSFPNLKRLFLGCSSVLGRFSIVSDSTTEEVTILAKHVEAGSGSHPPSFFTGSALKKINAPYMETFYIPGNDAGFVKNCENLEEIYAPMLRDIVSGYVNTAFLCLNQPKLRRMVLGTITGSQAIMCGNSGAGSRPKLIDLELGAGTAVNLSSLQYWNPSYVLSDNPTGNDLVTDEGISTNLDQFLQNFREHIALRLTANGSGKTLTLSQAVRNAIHAAESTYGIENIIVTQKGWTISPAPN